MHAAFVLPRFYPYRGGYENSMLAIARGLVTKGHRATIFTTVAADLESLWLPGYQAFPAGDFDVEGVAIRRFSICYKRLRRRLTRLAGMLPYWRWKAQYWTPGFRVPGLYDALRHTDADLFHIGPLPYNNLMYLGLRAAEFHRVPLVATPCLHLGESEDPAVAKDYTQPHQIKILRRCNMVVCMTVTEQQKLAEMGVSIGRTTVIPHGIDLELATGGDAELVRKRYQIDGPIVLHLGMKAFDKGSVTVVEAMKKLWMRGSRAWLVMAGPSTAAFDQFLSGCGKSLRRLINLPAFADEDKRDLLAAADIVVQPSRVESLGLVLLEAWANSKPVIAANIEVSHRLLAESGGGVLVPFGDSDRLAETMAELLKDPEKRRAMGDRAKIFAQSNYDSRRLWAQTVESLEVITEQRRGAAVAFKL